MMLLTKEILARLPKLYATDSDGMEATVQVKFFTPDGSHTWYGIEYDPEEGRFFGLVTTGSHPPEFGYFLLSELKSARGLLGLPIERDRHFETVPVKKILETSS